MKLLLLFFFFVCFGSYDLQCTRIEDTFGSFSDHEVVLEYCILFWKRIIQLLGTNVAAVIIPPSNSVTYLG